MTRRMNAYLQHLLDDVQFAFYKTVCDFADKEIAPQLLSWERQQVLIPADVIGVMGDLGLFGLTVDEAYGGQGGSQIELVLMGLALGYHSQSVAITPGAAASLGIKPLQLYGRDDQKAAHLPALAAGKRMFAFGLSEPQRGSDAANPLVTAERVKGGWRIKGEKCWTTNAKWASHIVVHAMTHAQGPPGYRSTCFIVPMDDPHVHYQEMQGKQVWLQSSTGAVAFDQVELPDEAILGEINEGFKVMVTTLNGGRLFIAALSLASLAFALDKCCAYAESRLQFNEQPIGRFQRVQDVLLDMDIVLEQGLHWLISLVKQYDSGMLKRESAAKVKIECSRRASDLLTRAMEMCGGVASLDEFGLIRHLRDLFVCRVGEGSNFVLQTLAAKSLLPNIADQLQ